MRLLAIRIACALAVTAFCAIHANAQNLLADPSFELGLVPNCNQGVVPDTWYISTVTPDVYSFDCSTLAGLNPAAFNNFPTLVAAQDGLRFVAGGHFGAAIEAFGQTLQAPLVAGAPYTLSGWFTLSYQWPGPGLFDIYLSANGSWLAGTLVGSIGASMVQDIWSYDAMSFVAPAAAATLPNLIVVPRSLTATPSSYMGTDDWSLTLDSATETDMESWGRIKGMYRH